MQLKDIHPVCTTTSHAPASAPGEEATSLPARRQAAAFTAIERFYKTRPGGAAASRATPPSPETRATEARLGALPSFHRGALALRFSPRAWSPGLVAAFGPWTSLVVRLDAAARPSATTRPADELDAEAARRLEEATASGADVRHRASLKRRAKRLVARALEAYEELRPPPRAAPGRAPGGRGDPKASARRPPLAVVPKPPDDAELRGAPGELAWFFNMAEVLVGVSSNFDHILRTAHAVDPWTAEDRVDAARRASQIRERLLSIADHDAGVLQAAFEFGALPAAVREVFGLSAGVAVRLLSSPEDWPEERGEQRAKDAREADRLAEMCARKTRDDTIRVSQLRLRSEALVGRALRAFEATRAAGTSLQAVRP